MSFRDMVSKRDWTLTSEAFERLLARLHPSRELAGQEYASIRQKLQDFFAWRGESLAAVHADETLDRVARRLEEGERVEHLRRYVYAVARLVLMELIRKRGREQEALLLRPPAVLLAAAVDPRTPCFEACLRGLAPDSRELISAYYDEDPGLTHMEQRRRLAERMSLTYGALKARAYRIRVELERCVEQCLQRSQRTAP